MRSKAWLIIFSGSLVIFLIISVFAKVESENPAIYASASIKSSIILPTQLEFAGEKIPLQYFDIKEALDRELHVNTYFQSQTIFFIKRAHRFFPEIESILREEGVPDDFKYLAVAESGLTNAVSPSKATGFWQFLGPTAKELGLEVNDEVDERYHIGLSTRAACKYLKAAYADFGCWAMAAASYNMGRPGLKRQVELQQENSYFDLLLSEETARYLFRIIAIKLVIENPKQYGFYVDSSELYPPLPYTYIEVSDGIPDMVEFAKKNNTNYKMLKLLNPWLRTTYLKANPKKTYIVKIPQPGIREMVYQEDTTAQVFQQQ